MYWNRTGAWNMRQLIEDARNRAADHYSNTVQELLDFYARDNKTWMEGYGTGEHTPYFERFFPNAVKAGNLHPVYIPALPRLIDTKAARFHRKPLLKLLEADGKETEDASQVAVWEDLQREMQLPVRLKEWDHKNELCSTFFGAVIWDDETQYPYLELLPPHSVWVRESSGTPTHLQTAEMIAHELYVQSNSLGMAEYPLYIVWERYTDESGDHVVAAYKADRDGNMEGVQPFGGSGFAPYDRYPYVITHAHAPTVGIYADIDSSLLSFAVGLDLLWTDYHLQKRMDGGFLTINDGRVGLMPNEIPFGRDRVLLLTDKDSSAEYVSSTSDVAGMVAFAQAYMQTFAINHGLTPDMFAIAGNQMAPAISAIAKQVDRLDLQEVREEKEEYWRMKLQELFGVIRMVYNAHAGAGRTKLRDDLRLKVEWPEPDMASDPLHEAQALMAGFNALIDNPVYHLMEKKNMTEEAALESVLYSAKIKRMIADVMGEGMRQTPESATEFQSDPGPDDGFEV